jgi:hypothetical protein
MRLDVLLGPKMGEAMLKKLTTSTPGVALTASMHDCQEDSSLSP